MAANDNTQPKGCPFTEEFNSLVETTLRDYNVPGLSIGVVEGDEQWCNGYGMAVLPSTKATSSTLWSVGSTSKAFTAAAMGILISKNNDINWHTPISTIITDDFILADVDATRQVTIEDCLSHRSGLPRHDTAFGTKEKDGSDMSLKSATRLLRHLPSIAPVRTKYEYANLPFMVIAHVIEVLSHSTLPAFVDESILKPLGMNSTFFRTNDAKDSNQDLAQGYQYVREKGEYREVQDISLPDIDGAGSMISSVEDYLKWIKSWLDPAPSDPLSPKLQQQLFSPRIHVDNGFERKDPLTGPLSYALGWVTGIYRGHQFWQHGGGTFAFGANIIIVPELKWGSVAFGNTAGGSNRIEDILMWWLLDEKLGISKVNRFDYASKFKQEDSEVLANYENAEKKYFPTIPSPVIPHSQPIEAYTGSYIHPAYGELNIKLVTLPSLSIIVPTKKILSALRTEHTIKIKLDFRHISGEYFLVDWDSLASPDDFSRSRRPALFKLSSDGVVKSVGVRMEVAMEDGDAGLIWFTRSS